MLGIILALISGALMSIQGVFNTAVTKASSVWVAAGFVQLTALLTCIAAWFFTGKYWRAARSILFGEAACILKSVMIRVRL